MFNIKPPSKFWKTVTEDNYFILLEKYLVWRSSSRKFRLVQYYYQNDKLILWTLQDELGQRWRKDTKQEDTKYDNVMICLFLGYSKTWHHKFLSRIAEKITSLYCSPFLLRNEQTAPKEESVGHHPWPEKIAAESLLGSRIQKKDHEYYMCLATTFSILPITRQLKGNI